MPWFCGYCSHWNKSQFRVCPQCGRPAKGRICKRCKETAPKDAIYCTNCGSTKLTEAGARRLPFSVPVRIGLLTVVILLGWVLVRLLTPFFLAVLTWLCKLLFHLLTLALVFWLITGLLPSPWGARLRGGV